MILFLIVALAFGAEFSRQPADSHVEIIAEMTRMIKKPIWDSAAARSLGIKAMDFPTIANTREAMEFYNRSFQIDGPVMLKDLLESAGQFNLVFWHPIILEYFQRYRLKHFTVLSKDLRHAIDDASVFCLSKTLGRRLADLFHGGDSIESPSFWPRHCLQCTKICLLVCLELFPAKEVLNMVFVDGIEQFDHLVVLNELNSKFDFQLDTWIQTQPHKTQNLLKAIRTFTPSLLRGMIPVGFLQAFETIHEIGYSNQELSFLAHMARHWPLQWLVEQHFPIMAITTMFWKYPDVLHERPGLIDLLPEAMPPIRQLVPTQARFSLRHATVFKLLSDRYGFERLEQAMNSKEILFYLYLSNDEWCKYRSLAICHHWPKDLTEMERAAWLLYHFTRLEPVTVHNSKTFILGFPMN